MRMVSGRWNSKLLVVSSTCHQGGSRFTMVFVVWNILDLNLEFEIDTKFLNDIMRSEIKMVGSHGWFTWFFFPQQYQTHTQLKASLWTCTASLLHIPVLLLPANEATSIQTPRVPNFLHAAHISHRSRLRPRLRQQQQEFVDLLIYGAILLRSPMVHSPLLSTNMNKT